MEIGAVPRPPDDDTAPAACGTEAGACDARGAAGPLRASAALLCLTRRPPAQCDPLVLQKLHFVCFVSVHSTRTSTFYNADVYCSSLVKAEKTFKYFKLRFDKCACAMIKYI